MKKKEKNAQKEERPRLDFYLLTLGGFSAVTYACGFLESETEGQSIHLITGVQLKAFTT